jgi:hypothetical protein
MKPLKEGEVICPVCNGKRLLPLTDDSIRFCKKCKGSGKLDWVELVVGKNIENEINPPDFGQSFEEYMKEAREAIIESCRIPKKYLGYEK